MLFLEIFVGILATGSAAAFPAVEDNSASTVKRASKFQWVGTNQAGAEFGNLDLPGTLGKHYTWPVHSSIDVSYHEEPVGLQADSISDPDGQGFQYLSNRVHDVIPPALLYKPTLTSPRERLVPDKLTGSLNPAYSQSLQSIVQYVTGKGAYAVLDPHNFGKLPPPKAFPNTSHYGNSDLGAVRPLLWEDHHRCGWLQNLVVHRRQALCAK